MSKLTIYQIKRMIENSSTPFFFSRKSLKFFNQTLKDFRVSEYVDGDYHISAPIKDFKGNLVGYTKKRFRPSLGEFISLHPYN